MILNYLINKLFEFSSNSPFTNSKNKCICYGQPEVGRDGKYALELIQTYKGHSAVTLVVVDTVAADPQQRDDNENNHAENAACDHQITLDRLKGIQFLLRFQLYHLTIPSLYLAVCI